MPEIKILFIEDDEEIAFLLKRYLIKESYSVIHTANGDDAIRLFEQESFHLVVLDLMIPNTDGYQVLSHVRTKSDVPILIISARSNELDKVLGLRMGADDYIGKPFGIMEFIARVHAILRRCHPMKRGIEASILEYNGMKLSLDNRVCTVQGSKVNLTSTEFALLKLLLQNPHKIFTKEEIIIGVWRDEYMVDDNKLLVLIRRLRKKVETNPSDPKYIRTVWGVGYTMAKGESV